MPINLSEKRSNEKLLNRRKGRLYVCQNEECGKTVDEVYFVTDPETGKRACWCGDCKELLEDGRYYPERKPSYE